MRRRLCGRKGCSQAQNFEVLLNTDHGDFGAGEEADFWSPPAFHAESPVYIHFGGSVFEPAGG